MRIAAYRGKSFVSRAIRWQTRGVYSHIAVMLSDDEIVEAWHNPARVRIIKSLSDGHTPGTQVDIFEVPTTPEQDAIIRSFLLAQVGKKYDFAGVVRFMSRRDKDNIDKWFCSELAFAAFQLAGVYLLRRIRAFQVDPVRLITSPVPVLSGQIVTD